MAEIYGDIAAFLAERMQEAPTPRDVLHPVESVKPPWPTGTIGWAQVPVVMPGGISQQHCVPVNDTRAHQLAETCPCKPEEAFGHPDCFTHFAFDQREAYFETRDRKLH